MSDPVARLSAALADRYRIERELGQGGMATVHLAADLRHDRKVAVKVLRPELAAVLGAERFVQEIRTTAQLQHPHILPLFDSGSADGFLYYVMPFIEGETLRDKLNRETQLGVEEAVRIAVEVADALDYAHRHGVIHRDIKPENILLHDGRPMVADFGIALAVSAAAGGRMTETGLSLGTPHYMSPEQATAEKDITARSDVYSLASVLYEMLTGHPPHVGNSAQQIIMKIVTEEAAPVTTLRKSVPLNVAAALEKALEKLPADRFARAADFAAALLNPAFRMAASVSAVGPLGRRSAVTAVGLTTAVVLVSAVALWGWLRPRPATPVTRYALALPAGQEPNLGLASTPQAAPDGSYLAYIGPASDGTGSIWIKRRDSYAATPVSGTSQARSFTLSPDGRSVAFTAGNDLKTVALGGGAPLTLVRDSVVPHFGLAWLDDGTIAYVATGATLALKRVPAGGGAATIVARQDDRIPGSPVALPGREALLFGRCSNTRDCDLWVYDLRRDTARFVVTGAIFAQPAATGQILYQSGSALMALPFDFDRLEVTGAPVSLADSVARFTLSRSGTLVQVLGGAGVAGPAYQMVWVDRSARQVPVDTTWTVQFTSLGNNVGWAVSPDGTQLAIGLNGEEGDDIWVKPLPRGPASRLTFDPGADYRPHWVRDGRSVTFVRAGALNGVYERRADGTGSDSLLRRRPVAIQEAVWSPDGQWLLMREGGNLGTGARNIVGMRLGSDTTPVPVVSTRYDEEAIALSPDGRWLAYQSDETGRTEIFIRPFPQTDQGKRQVSSEGGVAPLWSRDGRELFYLSGANDMMAVRVSPGATLTLGEPAALFHVPDDLLQVETAYYTPWDVAPDGRFLMARRVDARTSSARMIIVVENFLEELNARMRRGAGH